MVPAYFQPPRRLRLPLTELVLRRELAATCAAEARAFAPLETGGLFLGTVDARGRCLVEQVVGPGPGTRRGRTWLEVDDAWQNDRIAELATGRPELAYLGEWHSHPDAIDDRPSTVDRRALLQLARFVPLRCVDPIMMILYPEPERDSWRGGAWGLSGGTKFWRGVPTARRVELVVI